MAFLSKRLRGFLTNHKRKTALYNRDTSRAMLAMDLHTCNTCQGWETRSEACASAGWDAREAPVLHEPWCKFYPSLANMELEHRLEEQGKWVGSKWDDTPHYFPNAYDENIERTKKAVKESKEKAKAFWATFGAKK